MSGMNPDDQDRLPDWKVYHEDRTASMEMQDMGTGKPCFCMFGRSPLVHGL